MSDWTILPDYAVLETLKYSTLISEFENNNEQRRTKWVAPSRMWKLGFKNRTKTEIDTVKTFFATKLGAYNTFTWTNPNDSTQYTVRFGDDEFSYDMVSYQVYSYELTFIEVK
jgi:phage-related protein